MCVCVHMRVLCVCVCVCAHACVLCVCVCVCTCVCYVCVGGSQAFLQSILAFDCGWKLNIKLHFVKQTSCDCMCEYSVILWKSGASDSLCSPCVIPTALHSSMI